MLLQQIVGALDKELDRLRTLRSIVSSLEGTFSVDFDEAQPLEEGQSLSSLPSASSQAAPGTPVVAGKRRRAGTLAKVSARTVSARASREAKEARALSSSIPAGPVVVMPAALAREIAARREHQPQPQEAKPEKGSLGSMIRALHLDATA